MRVGAGLGDVVDAGDAGGAALVFDHDLLAEVGGHRLREMAAEDVGGTAGRKGHDQGERLAGKGRLGVRLPACVQGRHGREAAKYGASVDDHCFLRFVDRSLPRLELDVEFLDLLGFRFGGRRPFEQRRKAQHQISIGG